VAASTGARISVSAADFRAKGYVEFPGLENGAACLVHGRGQEFPGRRPALRRLRAGGSRAKATPEAARSAVARDALEPGESGAAIAITPPASGGGSAIVSYSLDVLPAGAHLVLEGRDVIHSDADHPLRRNVQGFAPAPGSDVAVSATNATGTGKPFVVRWP
jgi:hypothetical protein